MEHLKKLVLEAVHNKHLHALLNEHLCELSQEGKTVTLIIDKLYAFHQINTRENIALLYEAIVKAFGEEADFVVKLHTSQIKIRDKGVPHSLHY